MFMVGLAASELAKQVIIAIMGIAVEKERSIMTFFEAFVYQTCKNVTLTDIAGKFTLYSSLIFKKHVPFLCLHPPPSHR